MIIKVFDAGPHLKIQNVLNAVRVIDGGVVFTVPGPQGDQGEPGEGLAPGGTTGQIPRKAASGDYLTEWFTPGSFVNKNFWQGTQAEYDTIAVKDPNTVYFIL